MDKNIEKFGYLKAKLISTSLKNFDGKFEENSLQETSSYVEFFSRDQRFVYKKTSICWLFRNHSYKSSSDRRYRVMNPIKSNKKKKPSVKIHTTYNRMVPRKRLAKKQK